jgi:hypothetical protein
MKWSIEKKWKNIAIDKKKQRKSLIIQSLFTYLQAIIVVTKIDTDNWVKNKKNKKFPLQFAKKMMNH